MMKNEWMLHSVEIKYRSIEMVENRSVMSGCCCYCGQMDGWMDGLFGSKNYVDLINTCARAPNIIIIEKEDRIYTQQNHIYI